MNNRLIMLRKSLKLTQQQFADKLRISRSNTAGYETGSRTPSDAVISLICATNFDGKMVNKDWLNTGEGEMFLELPEEDAYFKAATVLSNDPVAVAIMLEYFKWDERTKVQFKESLKNIVKTIEEHEN